MKPQGSLSKPLFVVSHLLLLAGLAIAQPLYDVLSRGAEFFVAHDAESLDLWLLIVILSLAPGLVAAMFVGVVARLHQASGKIVLGIFIGIFSALVVLPPLTSILGNLATPVVLSAALLCGFSAAWAYLRWPPAQTFLTVLSPAIVLFPLLFVIQPMMKSLLLPQSSTTESGDTVRVGNPVPVVLLVLDELPLSTLLDEHGQLDAERFPGFVDFASTAHWFRNATTPAQETTYAIPAILTGRYPAGDRLPTAQDYPNTVFNLLGKGGYHLEVFESHTRICPPSLCTGQPPPPPFGARFRSLLWDVTVVYLHSLLSKIDPARHT